MPQLLLFGLSRHVELAEWGTRHHVRLPPDGLSVRDALARPGGTLTLEAGCLVLRGVTDPDRDRALRHLPSRRVLARVQVFDLADLVTLRPHCAAHAVAVQSSVPDDQHGRAAFVASRRAERAARRAGHRLPWVMASVVSALHGDLLERGLSPDEFTGPLEAALLRRDVTTDFASALDRHRPGMRRVLLDGVLRETARTTRATMLERRSVILGGG